MTTQQPISADFPFESRYVEVHGSKIHYVEEGSGDPVLFLHGQPTSSYLWRNVIPHVSPVARAIAMDNIGFGKSDKPDIEYRFVDHSKYVEGFIETLGLKNVTLRWTPSVGQHWGNVISEGPAVFPRYTNALLAGHLLSFDCSSDCTESPLNTSAGVR